jgi:hypothetical protein
MRRLGDGRPVHESLRPPRDLDDEAVSPDRKPLQITTLEELEKARDETRLAHRRLAALRRNDVAPEA